MEAAKAMELFSEEELWLNDSALLNTTDLESAAAFLPAIPLLMDRAITMATVVILFITMVSLGCTMEVSKIKAHIVKPKGVAIAVVAQYGIMPLTAFSLAKVFQLGPLMAVTVLICGCCPGGNLSNILALALQGDMNLSIVMTTCSTVLALGVMPLLLYLYCQGFPGLEHAVPYGSIALGLVVTLVPCGVGILINYYRPRYSKTITKVGMSIMLLSTAVICVLVGLTMELGVFMSMVTPPLMATAALMPLVGFTFGYLLSYLFRLSGSGRRTVAMETGCQNLQLCSAILKVAFPPEVIGPLYLFPMFYILFQVGEAVLLILAFRLHQRFFRTPDKEKLFKPVDSHCQEMMAPDQVPV